MSTQPPARAILLVLTTLASAAMACGGIPLPKLKSSSVAPSPSTASTEATTPQAQLTSRLSASLETLVVRSYPSGLKTYVVPKSKLSGGDLDTIYLTAKEYLVGQTPVEVKLEPGEYRVTITNFDAPIDFREDGEVSKIFVLDLDGNNVASMKLGGKTYAVTKRAGRQAFVSALFWPKDQPLGDFVKGLPADEMFPAAEQSFEPIFQNYQVPTKDRGYLLSMLRRTGKAVWYGTGPSQHLFIYFIETAPDYTLTVEPVK